MTHHLIIFEGVRMRLHSDHHCVLVEWSPVSAVFVVCLLWVHVAGLTSWHDEVLLMKTFDVNMRSHLGRIATVVYLTFLGEFSAGLLHPVFFPISLLFTGSHHVRHLVSLFQSFPSHG